VLYIALRWRESKQPRLQRLQNLGQMTRDDQYSGTIFLRNYKKKHIIKTRLKTSKQPVSRKYFLMALPAHLGPRPRIQFRNNFSQSVGLFWRVISPLQGRYINTEHHKHRTNPYTHQTFMPWVGFEPTIPESERARTVHALDRVATVIGKQKNTRDIYV
jgi:hypothetical protein